MRIFKHLFFSLLILGFAYSGFSQDNNNEEDTLKPIVNYNNHKGFNLGFYIGSFWANKQTASLYDGYGFDQNGQQNNFANSLLLYQINYVGGRFGGNDLIAQLLNVDTKDWDFTEKDMPINMRYITTYLVGLNTQYKINKKSSFSLNINGTKLKATGKFTITTKIPTGSGLLQAPNTAFTINGEEQRLMFQFGYKRYFGKNEKINFLLEGGINIILSKAQKNQVIMHSDLNNGQNDIYIDLMNLYQQPPYNFYSARYLVGAGIGFFAGAGINFNINPKYSLQFLYNPSYDRIALGYFPKFKMQHGCGLRVYYNMN